MWAAHWLVDGYDGESLVHLAGLHLTGLVGTRWVSQRVEEIYIRSDYADGVLGLPLGSTYGIDDEWAGGWDRSPEQLAVAIRTACEEQLRQGSAAS